MRTPRRIRTLATLVAAASMAFTGMVATSAPASAGTGLVYHAVDADNDPYSGIYLRNGTSMGNVDRVYSRYMYYGNRFELNCGTWGESVGPYNNRRWHNVRVIDGPAAGQTGWIADRYADTPNKANQPTPGEPECGASSQPPAPLPGGGSLYYSPYDGSSIKVYKHRWPGDSAYTWVNAPSPATITLDQSTWQPGCNASRAVPQGQPPKDKRITTLAGWSSGRNGPIMYLYARPPGWEQIDFLLLIDPGNKDAYYTGACDTAYPSKSAMLADWLASSPNHRIMVLAGEYTADYAHPVNGYAHAGIQNKLFPAIRSYPVINGRNIRNQVVVCNYNGVNHEDMWMRYKGKMNDGNHTSCPGSPNTVWHP
jgi:hypothetical protein